MWGRCILSDQGKESFVPFGSGAGESLAGVQKETPLSGGTDSTFKEAEQVLWKE